MTIDQYIQNINNRYKRGNATEHTFRGDLQQLLESLVPDIVATNEPKRQKCGAPDYILTKKDIPVGFIEAKDIGDNDLAGQKKTGNKEQFDRYKASLSNIIFTDYLDFHLYRDGVFITSIRLAELFPSYGGAGVVALPQNFTAFTNLIKDFCTHISQTIKSSKKLAEMMAGKARLLADVIEKALNSDEATQENSTLKEQMIAFREILIHDITPKAFADVYAQTIAYGMFAARLHDPTLPTFSRQEAAELIPKSNPFLRKLFGYIAGPDIDDRIKWIVDSLVEVFLACNVEELLKNYGKSTKTEDPIIHFYETFLSEYDASLRKARGVWYTPHPVVNFIVRAVDDILKTEFNLPQGLADTSKTKIKVNLQSTDKRYTNNIKTIEEEVHRVQILDPATGTGTFLAEVVKHIHKKFEGQQGIWSNYVEKHLLPRLNGFELLMASYAMAHLQLDLLLTETGYKPTTNQRFKIYLTNSLEESHPDTGTLFANWLSSEANEANQIKRDTPVMCIIGNPPYSGESANKGEWIMQLMEDYKKEPGGKEKLNERNPKWINGDENKFIRYGQHFIEKNGSGVLAFINPHSFLDNPTFRGMRWNLLKTFDMIYVLDLHGNNEKNKTSTDGLADVNVFDIMQGVCINLFIKTGKKKATELGKIFHFDLYGKREMKYDFLLSNSLKSIAYKELPNIAPNYFFVSKNFNEQKNYEEGFKVNEIFEINNVGIVTSKDAILINENKSSLLKNVEDYYKIEGNIKHIKPISYRPFDNKLIYYDTNLIERAREKVMKHFFHGNNIGLVIARQCVGNWQYIFISNLIGEFNLTGTAGRYGSGNYFPLYLYPETTTQISTEEPAKRVPNLNSTIVDTIAKAIDGCFVWEKNATTPNPSKGGEFAPIDVLDYIYAVLHSPTYREKYKEFLKIDFPRVPYPKDATTFENLVTLGRQLREIHLLESPVVENYITQYPIDGDNVVAKIVCHSDAGGITSNKEPKPSRSFVPQDDNATCNIFINQTQYFANVPQLAWEFYIGGYQPAQKWLKDRKGRTLDFEDILHYQKIIVALTKTDRLMKEIDKIEIE
jgi:predicted helicase